jgi:hypothetical protein
VALYLMAAEGQYLAISSRLILTSRPLNGEFHPCFLKVEAVLSKRTEIVCENGLVIRLLLIVVHLTQIVDSRWPIVMPAFCI